MYLYFKNIFSFLKHFLMHGFEPREINIMFIPHYRGYMYKPPKEMSAGCTVKSHTHLTIKTDVTDGLVWRMLRCLQLKETSIVY